jgi:hypothetical protein
MTTIGYTKYTLNLYTWLTTVAKVPWTLCIVCCDKESEMFFRRENVPYVSWSMGTRTQVGMAAFGTIAFEKCNHQKLLILEWFAKFYSVCGIEHSLYLDGDIVVRRDPWPLLLPEFSSENILFQCDCFNDTDHVDCGVICSGVIATRHVSESQANLYTFDADLWEKTAKQDQPFIAKRLEFTSTPFKIISRRLFGNGTWQKSGQWKNDDWCLLHYNYLVSSTKKSAMKKAGHWLVMY